MQDPPRPSTSRLCNPYLSSPYWGASHRGSYAQASSPFPGLENAKVKVQHLDLPGVPIQIQFSHDAKTAWGSLIEASDKKMVFKADVKTGRLLDLYIPADREPNPPPASGLGGITGSYNILDYKDRFIVPRQRTIEVLGDATGRKVKVIKRFAVPDSVFCGDDDRIAGATMTYGGYVAFATANGVVGTIPEDPAKMTDANLRTISVKQGAVRAQYAADLEAVSNSIAADETGGIYVVTSKRMRRFDHNPKTNKLTSTWSAPYASGSGQSAIRLGEGSGSTPTVMGRGKQRFVVITDGNDVMHQNLFWANRKLPAKWKGLGKGRDRRMACDTPINFGDPNATAAASEQSVTVRGYATFNVNNFFNYDFSSAPDIPILRNVLAALRGGDPAVAARGAERVDWLPKRMRCKVMWTNKTVSIPNGIPAMSAKSNLVYGMGQHDTKWGVNALDWSTGKLKFFAQRPTAANAPKRPSTR